MVTLLERCRISPPLGSAPETSLPLTFFDIIWINFHPIRRLLFYEFTHSKTHFTQTLVPNLKDSLSLALKHFFPLAGNLILPSSSSTSKPCIRYAEGDSVSLTFAECGKDFNYLTSNDARNAEDFHPLVPELPHATHNASNSRVVPLLAVQVTLFPNHGISVGFTNEHLVGDASSMFSFMKAWSLIIASGGETPLLEAPSGSQLIPFYDRSVIKDPKGLYSIYCSQLAGMMDSEAAQHHLPTNKVRATFVMGRADIEQLKKLVLAKRPTLKHVSSFTIVCAYVWTCLTKSHAASGGAVHEDDSENFICAADARFRVNPPIPANYFGNCAGGCFASAKSIQLMGEEGFLNAAESIGEAIHSLLCHKEGILHDAEMLLSKFASLKDERILGVSGSPKFNLYDTDFGWGKPKKVEVVSIDHNESMSLSVWKESEGGLEVGLSLPKIKMDAFVNVFTNGLKNNE